MPQSPDIAQNSDRDISNFRISGKEKLSNSRASDDIELKLGPVTKFDRKNKTTSKIDDDVVLENCGVTVNFPVFGLEQSGNQILDA